MHAFKIVYPRLTALLAIDVTPLPLLVYWQSRLTMTGQYEHEDDHPTLVHTRGQWMVGLRVAEC